MGAHSEPRIDQLPFRFVLGAQILVRRFSQTSAEASLCGRLANVMLLYAYDDGICLHIYIKMLQIKVFVTLSKLNLHSIIILSSLYTCNNFYFNELMLSK